MSEATLIPGAATGTPAVLELGTIPFQEANARIAQALEEHASLRLTRVLAQRYLGAALPAGRELVIEGIPGNDLACYMDGGSIEVLGNAQDQVGNTMNGGRIVIHGRCGDAAGYAMRGGTILVRDDCGWRVGIHMKQYLDRRPAIVIGGNAGSFLGEYLAGGIIVLLGQAGDYLATGMHGGVIYLRTPVDEARLMNGLVQEPIDEADRALLTPLLREYNEHFAAERGGSIDESGAGFFRIRPASSRPYAALYAD